MEKLILVILCFSIVTNVVLTMRDQKEQEKLDLELWEEAWLSLVPNSGSGRFVDLRPVEDLLLVKWANPNGCLDCERGGSILHWVAILRKVAWGKNEQVAELMIDNGANFNFQDCEGFTPLHVAIECRRDLLVELLLSKGADPNIQNNLGDTSLHYAAKGGRLKIFKLLLTYGADIRLKNLDGCAPAQVARKGSSVQKFLNDIRELALAFAQASIVRLGFSSPVHTLPDELFQEIVMPLLYQSALR